MKKTLLATAAIALVLSSASVFATEQAAPAAAPAAAEAKQGEAKKAVKKHKKHKKEKKAAKTDGSTESRIPAPPAHKTIN